MRLLPAFADFTRRRGGDGDGGNSVKRDEQVRSSGWVAAQFEREHPSGAKQAAEKVGILRELLEKHTSGPEGPIDSTPLYRG